ncbi:MAG: hypothetical protein JNJ45_06135 [Chthonomonas sp.]|nr:hypothetical protein [Chthonomonas sp.]
MTRQNQLVPTLAIALAILYIIVLITPSFHYGPTDKIMPMVVNSGVEPDQKRPWNVLEADGVLQFQPWRKLVLESWAHGEIPQWNPYQLAGTPLLANSQSAGLYPPHVLLGVLHVPWDLAMRILLALHLFLCYLGMRALALSMRARLVYAEIFSLAFAASPFLTAWSPLPSVVYTVAWIPMTLFWVRQACRGRGSPAWVGLGIGMMLLSGHLQFASYGLLAVLCFGLTHLRVARIRAAWVVLAAVGGGLLAMPQVLPALEFSKISHRAGAASEQGYEAYKASSITARELPALLEPRVLGRPGVKIAFEGLPEKVGATWLPFLKRGGNFAESAFGLTFVVLAGVVALRQRSRLAVRFGFGLMLLSLLLMAPTFLQRLMYFAVPGWSSTGSPGRAGVLFLIGGVIVATTATGRGLHKRSSIFWGLCGLATLCHFVFMRELGWHPLFIIAPLAWGFGMWHFMLNGGWLPLRLLNAAVVLFMFDRMTSVTLPRSLSTAPDVAPLERVAWINDKWNLYVTPKATMPGNLSSLYGIRDIAGYDSLMSADTVALLKGVAEPPPENGNLLLTRSTALPESLADLGVTHVFRANPDGKGEHIRIPGPGIVTGGEVLRTTAGRWELRATGPMTVRERNLPGWSLTVNGTPTELPPGTWLTAPNAASRDQVVFTYRAPGMDKGFQLACGGMLAILLASFLARGPGKVKS